MNKRGEGVSRFSVENFLSHSTDKFRRRTLLCFERVLVSKFFKQKKGEASRVSRLFFLTGPKKFCLGTNLFFRKFLAGIKALCMKGGGGGGCGITNFRRKFFCLTVSKNSVGGNPLVFPKVRVSKSFG